MMKDASELSHTIIEYLQPYGIRRISIFGSFARGTATAESDIDILVDFLHIPSLQTLVHIEQDLTRTLGITVDLITRDAISPYILPFVEKEEEVIYERSA